MHCAQCGNQVMEGQVFCSKCGQPVSAGSPSTISPPPSFQPSMGQAGVISPVGGDVRSSRVARHLNVLGILWIIYSVLRVIPGLFMVFFGQMRFPFMMTPLPAPFRQFLGPFLSVLGIILVAFGLAGLLAGWGLMSRQTWARMLTIVLGCINLIHIPFGTALGVYTLWVLVPQDAANDYPRLCGGA